MTDLDIKKLAQEWQSETAALAISQRKAQRQYWLNRLALGFEFGFCGLGLWGAWYFAQQEAAVYTVSACVLLAVAVLGVCASIRERMPLWHWHDWSPDGVLAYRIRQCESALRIAKSCKYSASGLLLFLAYIWINAFLEPASMPGFFPPFYTVVVLTTVGTMLLWARRALRDRSQELAQLRNLLASDSQ